jgi:hypothetical protein
LSLSSLLAGRNGGEHKNKKKEEIKGGRAERNKFQDF